MFYNEIKHNIKCLKGLQKYRLQQKALKRITLFFSSK